MFVFRGSPWQMGHGQKGYGLGGLFRTVARTAVPLVKRGAKALGQEVGQEVPLKRERHPLRQAGVRPEKGKHQEPNAELKRERHPYR